ncbi:STAS domain-containing protein [Streptomyces nigra]
MLITTTDHGATAVITPRGNIDHEVLPALVTAASSGLPPTVTHLTWNFEHSGFIDVAGLHLLDQQRQACRIAHRTLTVTGLSRQPLRILQLADELFPAKHWRDFLPSSQPLTAF